MADPTGGFQQPCPWQNANIPAVLTVRGNIGDADLPHRLNAISTWLQQMAQKGEQEVKVSRVQPWNSVRVTFNIPRSAAQRLQELAETRNQQLRDLGILAVQVEGHQEVVLNTPPPISMTGPPMAPGLPATAAPPFQQSPQAQGIPRPAWATSPGGQVAPGETMIPGQFSPVGNIRPPSAAQVPAFSFTAQQMGQQNRMPMPSPGGFVRPPQDQLPFRPDQVPSNAGGPPEQGGFLPTPQNFPRGFPPGFHPDGSSGFPGNQGPPGPMQGQMLPSMQVRGGATRLPVHHLLHNAGLAQSAGGGDPNLQGRDVTQSSPLLVNLLQNDISGNPNISLAISRTTQSLMQQGGMQGNLQQQLAMLQQSGLLPQGNMASPGALQNILQQAGMLQQQQEQQQQQQPPPKKPAKRRDRSRARQRNKSNQQAEAGLHNVPPLPSPQAAMSPALSAGSPALSASPNLSASPSMAGGMASPSTQHFPTAPSPSLQQGFPSTSSPSLPQGFARNSSPAIQNNFPTTSSPAVPPNYPATSSPAVPPNFPPSSSPMQQGFPPSSSPAMQLPTSTQSMPPGFPATSASGMPPGFPPSSGAQPHFQPPSSVAMQQPGFPGMPGHGNMTQNFPNNPSPSYQQTMSGSSASPMHTPFSNAPSPTMQQNFPRTSQSQPTIPQNFQSPFPNRPPQPGMQQFSNHSQMFPNLPPNAQSPFPNQRFPNPNSAQPPFPMTSSPSQQPQFPNMSQQQRFPPSSSPNFQSPFPNSSTPNSSMAAFINQMQNSAAKAMSAMPNANVPPQMLNMREGGPRGMNEGPSPLASLSNQVGQVPQPPMPPGMGQQRSPGANKQQAMPPGGVKDVPFDPPTSAHSFLQGQAEFQSAFLRYVQSQQRQPPPRGGRRASPGAAASPGMAGLGPRGAPTPPRLPAPQPGMMFPHPGGPGQAPGSASPHQPTMEPPLGPGAPPTGSMGPNNGTPKVPDKLSETPTSNTTTPPGEGTPLPLGHPPMGPPLGQNGSAQPPPVTTAPSPGTGAPPLGAARATPPGAAAAPTPGVGGPPPGSGAPPHVTTAPPPVTAAPPLGAGGPPPRMGAPLPIPPPGEASPLHGTGGPPPRVSGLSPRMAAPMSQSSSPTAGKTPGPDNSQQNQSLPDSSSQNQSQPDQAGKSGPAGDSTASPAAQTPAETSHGQPQVPSEPPGGNGTAPRTAAELEKPSSAPQQPVTHEVTTEKAGAEEQGSSPSVPPEVQGNGKTPCTASQVEPQPDGTGTGQDKAEGEGGSMGEGVSKGGAQEVAMETAPPQDGGGEMSGKEPSEEEGGGGEKGEAVAMETEVVAPSSEQKESVPVSSTETPCSTDGPVQSVASSQQSTEVKKVDEKPPTAETGNKDLPPAGETGTARPTQQAGKDSETTAAVQKDQPGGAESSSTANENPGQPASDSTPGADEKKEEEKAPEVPPPSQEPTAKKRELPKDLEEKGPSPHKQSKS